MCEPEGISTSPCIHGEGSPSGEEDQASELSMVTAIRSRTVTGYS